MPEWADDDEASLLTAVAGGDATAFGVLYRRHLPVVLRWCLRETGNREVAADLSAEVFAAALISAHRYRAAQGSVLPWLLGIARNKLLESRRRKRVEDSARRRLRLEPVSRRLCPGSGVLVEGSLQMESSEAGEGPEHEAVCVLANHVRVKG